MDFQEVGWKVVDCIALAQNGDRRRVLLNVVMNFRAV